MRWALLGLLMTACGGGATPPRPVSLAPAPPIATRPHVVQPYELVLRGAPALGVQRAIVARHGTAWLRLDGEPDSAPGWGFDGSTAVAVAEVRDDRVRILHEEDDARVLLWIERDALATVTRREVGLLHDVRDAPAVRGRGGVVVAAGTIVAVTSELDGYRVVQIEADGLYTDGMLGLDAIGDVWTAVAPSAPPPEPTHWIASNAVIRSAADGGGWIRGVAREPVEVHVHGEPRDGWYEVETVGPAIIVRGFAAAAEVTPDNYLGYLGSTGSGHGYGSSHRISLDLPAGACLYDRIGGEVIGLNTIARTRLGSATEEPGWWTVLVGSPWGLLELAAHAPGGDDDPQWETCR